MFGLSKDKPILDGVHDVNETYPGSFFRTTTTTYKDPMNEWNEDLRVLLANAEQPLTERTIRQIINLCNYIDDARKERIEFLSKKDNDETDT